LHEVTIWKFWTNVEQVVYVTGGEHIVGPPACVTTHAAVAKGPAIGAFEQLEE
jgi:hypothetical protein